MRKCPPNLEEIGNEYSNFDCVEPPKPIQEQLRNGEGYLAHPAWDHWGRIWFEDGQFHEEVKRYHAHVDTVSADTLRSLFNAVNNTWGWD